MLDDPELGFNVHDIDSISPRWKCFSCQFIIRKAHQLTGCGHRLCESCLKRLLRDPNATLVMCPLQDCGETTEIHKVSFGSIDSLLYLFLFLFIWMFL